MYRSEHAKIYCLLLGKHIKNLRKEKNITLKEISQKTGIKIQYLMKIENGTAYRVKIVPHLYKIANALNITFSTLFDFEK